MPGARDARPRTEVSPRWFPPPGRPDFDSTWRLGVWARNTDTGVVITRVVPGSAAASHGLEEGDRIVAVNGYQIGWLRDRLYPLGEELQRRAGRRGFVSLLVQNVRNQELLPLDVQLDRQR
jgi:S1-C subfamily serine protease